MLKDFLTKLATKQTKVGVIGMGYAHLPLAITYTTKGVQGGVWPHGRAAVRFSPRDRCGNMREQTLLGPTTEEPRR